MRKHRRLLAYLTATAVFAVLAIVVFNRQNVSIDERYGQLQEVLVATTDIPRGDVVDAEDVALLLSTRRIPADFVAPGTLAAADEAVGLEAQVNLPAGGYITAAMLAEPGDGVADEFSGHANLPPGERPVEVSVHAASDLVLAPPDRVDLYVTFSDAVSDRATQTRRVATSTRLLAIGMATASGFGEEGFGEDPSGETGALAVDSSAVDATVSVDERTAIVLIDADALGRRITLLATPSQEPGSATPSGPDDNGRQ